METKMCRKCKQDKNVDLFHKNKGVKSGIGSYCKECANKNVIESKNKKGPYKSKSGKVHLGQYGSLEYQRSVRLLNEYGITLEDYDNLLVKQKDCCSICKRHKSEFTKPLSVDHCHKSLKVRGLLCHSCNVALGLFRDNIDALKEAIKYLS